MATEQQLVRGASDLLVLSVLADGPLYGYAIAKRVGARSDERIRLTPGVLYPLLHELEQQGLLLASWDKADGSASDRGRKRKWYRLSAKGKRRLAQRAAAHRAFHRLIESFLPEAAPEAGS